MQTARLRNFQVWYENKKEYHSLKREIFGSDIYYVDLPTKEPFIIDIGAHIGLATLYFKMIFPDSKILAIEPHPRSFSILSQNMSSNGVSGVEKMQVAVGVNNGQLDLYVDEEESWLSSSSAHEKSWNDQQKNSSIEVKMVSAKSLITKKVDLLKIDVEGMECEILLSLGEKLKDIEYILFEYHPRRGDEIENTINMLVESGFEVTFSKHGREVDWRKAKGLLLGEAVRR